MTPVPIADFRASLYMALQEQVFIGEELLSSEKLEKLKDW